MLGRSWHASTRRNHSGDVLVSRASGNVSETVEASEVLDESPRYQTGSSREYPFAMDVPESAGPCLETDLTSVGWWPRATVERRIAFDPNVQVALNVYNGPTLTQLRRSGCASCGEARKTKREASTENALPETGHAVCEAFSREWSRGGSNP